MVHNTNLLVMGEEELVFLELVRRSLNEDIGMKIQEGEFGVFRVDRNGGLDVSVNDDKDLNAFSGLLLKKSVQSPFLADSCWSSHIQLRT